MPDVYDREIERLTDRCNRSGDSEPIYDAWNTVSPLFALCSSDPEGCCGCLTQVRAFEFGAETDELTAAIRADNRIPDNPRAIGVLDLPVFAEWQRRLDRELNRPVPSTP